VLLLLCCFRHIAPLATAEDGQTLLNDPSAASRAELKELVDSLADTQPAGALVRGRVPFCVLRMMLCVLRGGGGGGEGHSLGDTQPAGVLVRARGGMHVLTVIIRK
jgi:hypothetical protein